MIVKSVSTCLKDKRYYLWILSGLGLLSVFYLILNSDHQSRQPGLRSSMDGRAWLDSGQMGENNPSSCRECHEPEHNLWHESHHARANRAVHPGLDSDAFNQQAVSVGSITFQPEWKNGKPMVLFQNSKGESKASAAEMVIGYNPLRQYMIPFSGGRWQVLEVAYDPKKMEWFNVFGNENRRQGEWGHWTGRGMNWNSQCASCHMTDFQKNYDPKNDRYDSSWKAMGITCYQCHGAMDGHGAVAKKGLKPKETKPTTEVAMASCLSCHTRHEELTGSFKTGDKYEDHYRMFLPDRDGLWYADGQIRDEVFEGTSLALSKMGKAGVNCLDCHEPHGGKLRLPVDNNALCLSCHQTGGRLKGPIIDPVAHGKHKPGSAGNLCINCHMTTTNYMQRHPRHDHGFVIPQPELTIAYGIPNACNKCHQDKTPEWSLEWTRKWYGTKMDRPELRRSHLVARAHRGDVSVRDDLLKFVATEKNDAWRATLTLLIGTLGGDAKSLDWIKSRVTDPSYLVRAAAAQTLGRVGGFRQELRSLLNDPIRHVRLDAAWGLRAELESDHPVMSEVEQWMRQSSDQPTGLARQGVWFAARAELDQAITLYEKAQQWDPYSVPLYADAALLLSQKGYLSAADQTLQRGITANPDDAELHYLRGLLAAERDQPDAALQLLTQAVTLNPSYSRAWYNLGLLQSHIGKIDEAIRSLQKAESLDAFQSQYPYALATIYEQQGKRKEAQAAARRVLLIEPNHPEALRLIK